MPMEGTPPGGFPMIRQGLAAAALLALGTHGALAQNVDWRYGSAVVTSVTPACKQNGIDVGASYDARYRHPNLGDNGNQARLSIFSRRTAHNFIMNVDFTNAFQTASAAVFVGGGFVTNNSSPPAGPYQPQIRMTKRLPANITADTPYVYMTFKIRGFFVNPGVTNCHIDLQVTAARGAGAE